MGTCLPYMHLYVLEYCALSDFISELLSRDCVEQSTYQCLKVLNCTWWNLPWRNAIWFGVSASPPAGAAENCIWSTEFRELGANFYCLEAKMCYLNATHWEYQDTQVCHCFMGDLSHHPLVPSYWLKRDSWHHLSAAGSPRWEQMADTDCRGQASCRECQQNCFQFCFIQNVLDTLTRFKNCRVTKIRLF